MTRPKIGFIALGCPKATVDAENILSHLQAEGYDLVSEYKAAELIIVNTCGFIDEAISESLDVIGEALDENGKVIVTGCLGRRAELIKTHYPEVLAITGPNDVATVMTAVHAVLPPAHSARAELLPLGGVKLTPRHYAYLKIAEGCNQNCSFCIIPSLRGKLHSRAMGEIVSEAQQLVQAGVKELLLVSQDTAAYGSDSKYQHVFWQGKPIKTNLINLLNELTQLNIWLRLHYIYPYPQVDKLVALMADGLILPYLDVPLQHVSPHLLQAMRRPANTEKMRQRIKYWRSICPQLTIRSTFIVGFPGETEADLQQLLDFLDEMELDRVGVFPYSAVEGAAANNLPNPVDEEEKLERLERVMALQAEVSADKLQQRCGKRELVIIDAIQEDIIKARSAAEAPEIDGYVIIESPPINNLQVGDWVQVTITQAEQHDVYAKLG